MDIFSFLIALTLTLSSPLLSSPLLSRPRASQLGHGERPRPLQSRRRRRRRQSDLEKAKRERLEKVCSSRMGGHQFCGLPRGGGEREAADRARRSAHARLKCIRNPVRHSQSQVAIFQPLFAEFMSINVNIFPAMYCSHQRKKDGRHYREDRA